MPCIVLTTIFDTEDRDLVYIEEVSLSIQQQTVQSSRKSDRFSDNCATADSMASVFNSTLIDEIRGY